MNRAPVVGAIACLAASMGAARAAMAQPLESLTFSVEWEKAVIAPGETNTGQVLATVGPAIGATTAWNSPPGTGQLGAIKAFASTVFNLKNLQNGTNGLCYVTIPSEFNASTKPISDDGNGGFVGLNTGQIAFPANTNPNTNQTVAILNVAWKAADAPGGYEVIYATKSTSGKVFLDVGLAAWVGENAVRIDGQGGFAVIPAPPTIAIIVPWLLAIGTRRRKP